MFGMGGILGDPSIRPRGLVRLQGMMPVIFPYEQLLWFEYLAVSPSYELARKFRLEPSKKPDRGDPLPHLTTVLSVFEDLGDVQNILFDDWWRHKAQRFFTDKGVEAGIKKIGVLKNERDSIEKIKESLSSYLEEERKFGIQRESLILAVSSNSQISSAVSEIRSFLSSRHDVPFIPKYALSAQRFHARNLLKYLVILYYWSVLGEESMWKIGEQVGVLENDEKPICPEFSVYGAAEASRRAPICPLHGKPTARNADRRHLVTILTHRAIDRALNISENAARGVFPSHKKPPGGLKPSKQDLRISIRERITARHNWLLSTGWLIEERRTLDELVTLRCCMEEGPRV